MSRINIVDFFHYYFLCADLHNRSAENFKYRRYIIDQQASKMPVDNPVLHSSRSDPSPCSGVASTSAPSTVWPALSSRTTALSLTTTTTIPTTAAAATGSRWNGTSSGSWRRDCATRHQSHRRTPSRWRPAVASLRRASSSPTWSSWSSSRSERRRKEGASAALETRQILLL